MLHDEDATIGCRQVVDRVVVLIDLARLIMTPTVSLRGVKVVRRFLPGHADLTDVMEQGSEDHALFLKLPVVGLIESNKVVKHPQRMIDQTSWKSAMKVLL